MANRPIKIRVNLTYNFIEVMKMDLYKEILIGILRREECKLTFTNLEINATEIVRLECYKALRKIKGIFENHELEDAACFMKIEEIVCLFEQLESDGGDRTILNKDIT